MSLTHEKRWIEVAVCDGPGCKVTSNYDDISDGWYRVDAYDNQGDPRKVGHFCGRDCLRHWILSEETLSDH